MKRGRKDRVEEEERVCVTFSCADNKRPIFPSSIAQGTVIRVFSLPRGGKLKSFRRGSFPVSVHDLRVRPVPLLLCCSPLFLVADLMERSSFFSFSFFLPSPLSFRRPSFFFPSSVSLSSCRLFLRFPRFISFIPSLLPCFFASFHPSCLLFFLLHCARMPAVFP